MLPESSGERPPRASSIRVDESGAMGRLLQVLDDALDGTLAPEEAISAFQEAQATGAVYKGFLDMGLDIVSEYLYRNLKESAEAALAVGKKRCAASSYLVNDLRTSLKNAKTGAHLDGGMAALRSLNFNEYEAFLLNVEARRSIAEGDVPTLLRCLQQKISGEPLTEFCVSDIFRFLCSKLEEEEGNSTMGPMGIRLFKSLLPETVIKILVGSEGMKPACSPYHPGVQMFGSRLLGLMIAAVQRDNIATQKSFKACSMLVDKSSKFKVNTKKSPFHREQIRCLETLYRLLDLRLEQKEHATIWSVLKTIQKICVEGNMCQDLLLRGLLPQLDKLFEFYHSVTELGPPEYAKAKLITVSKQKPPFPQQNARPPATEPSILETSSRPTLSRYTLARNALKMGNKDPRLTSLLYLLGEDYVDALSFRQLCDRNMMLLLIKNVRARCEKSRQALIAPWHLPVRGPKKS